MAEQDTEITLGTGKLLGLFFGLVIVCAIFFGLGFSLGRSSVKSTLTMEETPAVAQPGANAGQKVAGGTPQKASTPDCVTPGGCGENTQSSAGAPDNSAANAPVVASPGSAISSAAAATAPELNQGAPGGIPSGAYTVQVAAVSKQEDADALVSALKKKAYPVFVASNNNDKLFHVQIGPFSDIKDAEAMKSKLTGDGYNPIVKR